MLLTYGIYIVVMCFNDWLSEWAHANVKALKEKTSLCSAHARKGLLEDAEKQPLLKGSDSNYESGLSELSGEGMSRSIGDYSHENIGTICYFYIYAYIIS